MASIGKPNGEQVSAYGGVGEGLPPRPADEIRTAKWPRGTQPLPRPLDRSAATAVDRSAVTAVARPARRRALDPSAGADDTRRAVDSDRVQRRRRELTSALTGGAPEPLTGAYLALAEALIADDRKGAAVHELENAISFLVIRRGGAPVSVWRVEALLATLYDLLGNPVRARRSAMDAHTHAVRSGCKIAERSTHALLHRLMASRRPAELVD